MSFELGRALLLTEAITPLALGEALLLAARDRVSLVRALLQTRAIDSARLEEELGRGEAPSVHTVVPARELVDRLPAGMCARILAIPVRRDPRTGTVDVVVPDLRDAHGALEVGFQLSAPVHAVRAPLAAIERALASDGAEPRRASIAAGSRATPAPALHAPAPPAVSIPRPPPAPSSEEWAIPLMRRSVYPSVYPGYAGAPNAHPTRPPSLAPAVPPPPAAAPSEPPPQTLPQGSRFSSSPPVPRRPSQPPPIAPDASSILAQIRTAKDRDTVLALVLTGTRAVAGRAALFVVRGGAFLGWACTAEFGDETALRAVAVPDDAPSLLSIAATNGSYLGPMLRTEAHAAILSVMGTASRDVAACPVRVFGRPAVMVLADDLGDTMIATRRMEELARVAGESLARLVRERLERS